jgi:hypothetical protein
MSGGETTNAVALIAVEIFPLLALLFSLLASFLIVIAALLAAIAFAGVEFWILHISGASSTLHRISPLSVKELPHARGFRLNGFKMSACLRGGPASFRVAVPFNRKLRVSKSSPSPPAHAGAPNARTSWEPKDMTLPKQGAKEMMTYWIVHP